MNDELIERTRILFPTDFGPMGLKAAETALYLERELRADLFLFHAVTPQTGLGSFFSPGNTEEEIQKAREGLLDWKLALDPNGKHRIQTIVGVGKPEVAIDNAAMEIGADLIILGIRDANTLRDTLRGRPVNHLIHSAPCPVMTFRDRPSKIGFDRILVPIGTGKEFDEKLDWSIRLAKRFKAVLYYFSAIAEKGEDQYVLQSRMKKAEETALRHDVEAQTEFQLADDGVVNSILNYSDVINADLILVTWHKPEGGGPGRRTDSIPDKIVTQSKRTVITVRPSKDFKAEFE